MVSGFGCKGLSTEEKAKVKGAKLNYWTVFNDTAQLKKYAEEYSQRKPQVSVNIRSVRPEEFEKLFVNALADDVSPDIISVHIRDLNKYRARLDAMPGSVTVPIVYTKGEYIKETIVEPETRQLPGASVIKSAFVGTVYDDVVVSGQVYGLPLALDTLALYYNKDLLDKAGIPEPPETWEEFMGAVKETTVFKSNGDILQSGVALGTINNIENGFDILSLFMMQSGVQIASGNYVSFSSGIDKSKGNHPTLSALRFYTDFAQPTKDVYTWDENREDALNQFVRGGSAFFIGFAYDYPRIKSRAPQMNMAIIKLPQLNPQSPVNVASYWVESVPKKAKNKNEAWDFIGFITSKEKIAEYTKATRSPSPLRSQIKEQEEDELLAPFASQILNATNWYHGRNFEVAKSAFESLVHSYLQPYPEGEDKTERDINLIIRAAQTVQQSM